jgi:hypothetical protein
MSRTQDRTTVDASQSIYIKEVPTAIEVHEFRNLGSNHLDVSAVSKLVTTI